MEPGCGVRLQEQSAELRAQSTARQATGRIQWLAREPLRTENRRELAESTFL